MAKIIELILDESGKRGKGTEEDPIRAVIRLWSKGGRLVAEYDPTVMKGSWFNPDEIKD